jgi:hypothetical protein
MIRVQLPPDATALPSPGLPEASEPPEPHQIPAPAPESPEAPGVEHHCLPEAVEATSPDRQLAPRRPRIRITLVPVPDPVPPKVMAFWNYDEDEHRLARPWRYQESPNEELIREQLERNGCWTG